ncbi:MULTISPECIES: outer membrane beta-barrel protein [Niastella]|uniref:Outer membrane beta-barrel protein n=1 Tax=Niastella soli TaxID=2821487 RepID=A0ABS3Z0Y8_9BACT|nr:outer membrane beta-barrel protein [Niastella soli]MBO9203427.1 outer membrane beta-barrel protein [Niastella soli]
MKKVFLAAFLLVSSNAIFAQVNKGQWLAGGSAAFNAGKRGDDKQTDITIAPDAGYFFIDQFAAGLRPEFGYTKTKTKSGTSTNTGSTTSFSLAPFVRYYFMPSGKMLNIFADASYGFGSSKEKGEESISGNYYQIKAGPAVFLTPNTALEFALYYKSYGGDAYENTAGDRYNNFGLSVGFQIHLGGMTKK